ncbi:MAG TPA: hypothetical protein VK631_09935 [Solirubrobacteraceae bacterium]|nr:hypothetical protein [Solirubrobacteraceae bacterium]
MPADIHGRHPYPAGARVHHRGCLWNRYYSEEQRQAQPSWGWATVIGPMLDGEGKVRQFPDRSYEYEVRYDAPHSTGGPEAGWWASYHIDEAYAPVPTQETAS